MCDYPHPEFYSESVKTARKAHRCEECRRAIDPGEAHVVGSGKWDGTLATHRFCLFCPELHRQADAAHEGVRGGDCIAFGELYEALREHVQDELGDARAEHVLLNQIFGLPDDEGLEPEDDPTEETRP